MKAINKSITDLKDMFHQRMTHFEAQLPKDKNVVASNNSLADEFADFKKFVAAMLANLQSQVEAITRTMDSMEMRSRRKMLLLHGVAEGSREDTTEVVVKVLNGQLKLSSCISAADISRCQRLGQHSSQKPRAILIKLKNVNLRDKVWFSKTSLKGSGITVSVFLTKTRHELFMSAREKFGINRCWTRQGHIYIQEPAGTRHRVATHSDITKLSTDTQVVSTKAATSSKTVPSKIRRAATVKK